MAEETVTEHKTGEENNSISSNEDLSASFATTEIPPDILDDAEESHETSTNNQLLNDAASYSSSSSQRHSTSEHMLDDDFEDDHLEGAKSASSRSSLSSIPDSVVIHSKATTINGTRSPSTIYDRDTTYNTFDNSLHKKIRDHNTPFRHPSSVRAIQMYTEDEDDEEFMSPSRRRGAGYRGSPSSMRSLGSPLSRRQGYHSAGATPKKPTVRTENPLVLLHCTVLPPTVVLGPEINIPERKTLERILPPRFWRRWKLLEEKIGSSGLLRDRGLLLQHPQEDYGLLEERLLESLELEPPRLENGHYVGNDNTDSENESHEDDDSCLSEDAHKRACPDCGCNFNKRGKEKKWDVKFYAANGLMREGAWTAAWKEIERVDVQVSLWLPYDVKAEVERCIQEEQILLAEHEQKEQAASAGTDNYVSQQEIDGLDDGPRYEEIPEVYTPPVARQMDPTPSNPYKQPNHHEVDLHTLLINYIRILASDRRNLVTVASVLIASFALLFSNQSSRSSYPSDAVDFVAFPVVSNQVYHASSASILTQASTEVPVVEGGKCVERPGEVQSVAERVKDDVAGLNDATSSVSEVQVTEQLEFVDETPVIVTETKGTHLPVTQQDPVEDIDVEQKPTAEEHSFPGPYAVDTEAVFIPDEVETMPPIHPETETKEQVSVSDQGHIDRDVPLALSSSA